MNRTTFYNEVKKTFFNNKLSQGQVNGMNAILDAWGASKYCEIRWLAYMLATTLHETASTMQPIEEYGKGRGRDYGKKLKMGGGAGKRIPYTTPNKLYYGRGFVQLTWYENYDKMGKLLGVPLLQQPELALNYKIAVDIMFEGMLTAKSFKGDFTGRYLEEFFSVTKDDPVNARRIINGLDKADLIAGYHRKFLRILKLSGY